MSDPTITTRRVVEIMLISDQGGDAYHVDLVRGPHNERLKVGRSEDPEVVGKLVAEGLRAEAKWREEG